MQKRLVLVCEDSLCPRKQPDVSGPGFGEAGRYIAALLRKKNLEDGGVRLLSLWETIFEKIFNKQVAF